MESAYRLAKVINGILHYAEVHLFLSENTEARDVIEYSPRSGSTDDWNVNVSNDLIYAAMSGAYEGLLRLKVHESLSMGSFYKVTIDGIRHTVADTNPNDLRIAALVATLKATDSPKTAFDLIVSHELVVKYK